MVFQNCLLLFLLKNIRKKPTKLLSLTIVNRHNNCDPKINKECPLTLDILFDWATYIDTDFKMTLITFGRELV